MQIARAAAVAVVVAAAALPAAVRSEPAATTARHAPGVHSGCVIRNVMVVYGNGKPAFGPMDVLVENGLIAEVRAARAEPRRRRRRGDRRHRAST